ncbi:Putative acyl-CoA dehydrogenase YdbM [Oceanibacterium hippocampi]|uniref:Putative acyl-CoA dehydrogenase YdbM n=1 Tax=Oceanibacterium hippocampi TaxID=745714 RepID=A0A1Y5TXC4_9PROT|nr:acyl-CoA dehydrogenase family protein [Oceanibacterium hippocampi]SLN72875.1 Putative acyl-CoA dehydrogenase YdbM [Oceanibacterium hippocampi]
MNHDLTSRQQELLDLVDRLGREKFAPRRAEYDRTASFPFENYDDLRENGLLGLCIPEAYGGLGADFETYCLVSQQIARYCGPTALTFNMHSCAMMWSGRLADDLPMDTEQLDRHERRRSEHFARVIEQGAIYAQPFSEGSAAAAGHAPFGTTARKVDGGWLMNGRKIFASLSGAADYYGILCTEDVPGQKPDMRDTLYLAVPKEADGLEINGDWDPLGMRATVSRNLIMKDVFVADNMQLMPRGIYFQAASAWPHMFFTLAPTYMGIAEAAYAFTVSYLRGEAPGTPPVKRRMFPTKQITTAEMYIKLEQMRALFRRVIGEAKYKPSKEERLRTYAAQFTIMEGANDMCRLGIRTCGGQSMLKSLPLEQLYRDSRCGSLMLPWTAELCLDRLGRETLYEAGERDD